MIGGICPITAEPQHRPVWNQMNLPVWDTYKPVSSAPLNTGLVSLRPLPSLLRTFVHKGRLCP